MNYGTTPIGAVLGGALGTAIGIRPTIWLLATGVALSGAVLLASPIRGRRELPASVAATARPGSAPA